MYVEAPPAGERFVTWKSAERLKKWGKGGKKKKKKKKGAPHQS